MKCCFVISFVKVAFLNTRDKYCNTWARIGCCFSSEDHINLQGGSPLAFKNVAEFGDRFVDMMEPYDVEMRKKIEEIEIYSSNFS